MENNGNGKINEHRLTKLETQMEFIAKQVSNHLPHQIANVETKLDGVNKKMWAFIVSVLMMLIGLVFSIIK